MGGLTLLAPLTLLGLLTLPLVWWILKISPPAPKKRAFPPLAILKGVETDEETPNATPIWVLLYRLLLVALAVFALSLPILQRGGADEELPLTLVIDDSALSATVWDDLLDDARRRVRDAQRANQDVVLAVGEEPDLSPIPASEALQRLRSARPRTMADQGNAQDLVADASAQDRRLVYLSSGISLGDQEALSATLREANATVSLPAANATVIVAGDVRETSSGFQSDWYSAHSPRTATVEAVSATGAVLAAETITFTPGASLATADISLPPQIRSQVARLRIAGMRAGAATRLLDDAFGRPLVGVLAPPSGTASPLLSEDFYAEQALDPYADLFIGDVETVLSLNPTVLVMPDSMSSSASALETYVEGGGVLIRFAGPQLARSPDDLVPVPLRRGGRSIGGALAWETPQVLAPFASESPFAGLAIPEDVTVSRQVMARPGAETDARTWARLEDGSPVVTSTTRGDGRIVLFHVTAGPAWSNLAISGLYVDMLKRILPLARARTVAPASEGGTWTLDRVLDPFGELRPPPPRPVTVDDDAWDQEVSSLLPGYYRAGTRQRAVQTVSVPSSLSPLDTTGLRVERVDASGPRSFAGLILAVVLALLALDMWLSAKLTGKAFRGFSSGAGRVGTLSAGVLIALMLVNPLPVHAQDEGQDGGTDTRVVEAASALHLAYVETSDARTDSLSRTALESLQRQLTFRTTIEPAGVHAVSLESEGLVMYPFLYWPVRNDSPALTPEERANINRYIAAGGTLVIDTADEAERAFRNGAPHPGLARVTEGLTIGRLVPVPDDHVLTKSFYLTFVFPGRWANGPVLVEAAGATAGGRDGVSSVIIGSNDWAAGWAIDETARSLVDLSGDIPRQREMAIRFGVNVAMYALSGNYKADQVHAAELIRRMGGAGAADGTGLDSLQDLGDRPVETPQ